MTMMNSLFSSFDPAGSLFSLNYLVMGLALATPLFFNKLILNLRLASLTEKMSMAMVSEVSASVPNPNLKGKVSMLLSCFFLILILNISGLTPYVFTMPAQMMFSLSLALPFWLSFIFFSLFKNTNNFISHMVPMSTPMALSHFMSLIELISLLIRPITLSVRLAANLTAGHILMGLASGPIILLNAFSIAVVILIVLEIAVAFIQSYVFTILTSMYLSETA